MKTTSKLAIPLAIAAALTAGAMLYRDATASPPASPTNPPPKGTHAVPTGADNFYKSDKVTVQKVTFKNQYQMTVAGNLFLPKDANKDAKLGDLKAGDEVTVTYDKQGDKLIAKEIRKK